MLLARVETLSGISHLTVARSPNGIDGWVVDPEPLLAPAPGVETELWGFEDPRIVRLDELDCWAITCTAYGPGGPAVYLATTTDFVSVERRGIIQRPEDKNAALLPERVGGEWILFHRPTTGFGGTWRGEIVLSRSTDLISWSSSEPVLEPRDGAWWDSLRVGIGPPLLKTEHGWLLIYHGVKETVTGGVYRVGLALLDLERPTRVLRRCAELGVRAAGRLRARRVTCRTRCSRAGSCTTRRSGDVRLYYGAADTSIGLATAKLDDLCAALLAAPD